MISTGFDEQNVCFGPPEGIAEDECSSILAWRGLSDRGRPIIVTCWKVTADEEADILEKGRIWMVTWGQALQPCYLTAKTPFSPQPIHRQPKDEVAELRAEIDRLRGMLATIYDTGASVLGTNILVPVVGGGTIEQKKRHAGVIGNMIATALLNRPPRNDQP